MLSQDSKEIKRQLKKGGFEAFLALRFDHKDMILRGNKDLDEIGTDAQVAGTDGIVRTVRVVNWSCMDEHAAYNALKKHKRI